jgi:predicted amidohydrolase YtcJ
VNSFDESATQQVIRADGGIACFSSLSLQVRLRVLARRRSIPALGRFVSHCYKEEPMKNIISAIFFIAVFSLSASGQQVTADLILLNGKVFTSDPMKPFAQAIAIHGERILVVGSDAEIKKLGSAKTRLVDLQGRVVIPGINDAHFHFTPKPQGFHLEFKSLEPSWNETVEAINIAVKQTPKGRWIFGTIGGGAMAETQANRSSLDRIAPDNPVLLETYYGHGQIINSKAMSRFKIDDKETDPLGGYFERDAETKKINGRIWEYAQWRQSRNLADQVLEDEAIKDLRRMADEAAQFGITSMQIMPTMRIERFVRLLEKADLPIRVRAMPFSLTTARGSDLSEIQELSKLKLNSKVTASGVKWILDGTPFERGAALRESYNDQPNFAGKLDFPETEIPKMVKESLALRQQLLVHCAGDKPIELLFKAMESEKQTDWTGMRWRIEHGDGLTKNLFPEAKDLGIIVVQNPTHLSLAEMLYSRYSPHTGFFNLRSLLEAGIPLALGSDGPMNPYLNIMLASINPVRPTEAITREQAVRAYTSGSAYAEFAENEKGTLTKGRLADLVALSQDIFTVPIAQLPKTKSILTITGGNIVYDAKVLR